MNKLYLVVIDLYDSEENSIVNICTTKEVAEEQIEIFKENSIKNGYSSKDFDYHIDEIEIDYSKDILWDCYVNTSFDIK